MQIPVSLVDISSSAASGAICRGEKKEKLQMHVVKGEKGSYYKEEKVAVKHI